MDTDLNLATRIARAEDRTRFSCKGTIFGKERPRVAWTIPVIRKPKRVALYAACTMFAKKTNVGLKNQ